MKLLRQIFLRKLIRKQGKLQSSPKKGIKLNKKKFNSVMKTYYEMMGWSNKGVPKYSTLIENHLEEFKFIIQ